MSFANANYSDILTTTIENRSRKIADNVTNNNAILSRLKSRGRIRTFSGGHKILQELSFAENSNAGWYTGYDILPTGVSDVISAAEYEIKQAAVPVVISGLEMLQNASREQMIDLMEGRMSVAETTLANLIVGGLYSDGTGSGGKQIDGLNAAVPLDPTASSYGNIDGSTFTFWQNAVKDSANTTTLEADWTELWSNLVRGNDRTDLILADGVSWRTYVGALQANQRFTNTNSADSGFVTVKFMDADVVLDGGIYNGAVTAGVPSTVAFFLNTNYIHYRPHSRRNMVALSPNRRYATNQDAEVQIIGWAGNLTTSGRMFQGRWDGNA
jgi:hypothetical protein